MFNPRKVIPLSSLTKRHYLYYPSTCLPPSSVSKAHSSFHNQLYSIYTLEQRQALYDSLKAKTSNSGKNFITKTLIPALQKGKKEKNFIENYQLSKEMISDSENVKLLGNALWLARHSQASHGILELMKKKNFEDYSFETFGDLFEYFLAENQKNHSEKHKESHENFSGSQIAHKEKAFISEALNAWSKFEQEEPILVKFSGNSAEMYELVPYWQAEEPLSYFLKKGNFSFVHQTGLWLWITVRGLIGYDWRAAGFSPLRNWERANQAAKELRRKSGL